MPSKYGSEGSPVEHPAVTKVRKVLGGGLQSRGEQGLEVLPRQVPASELKVGDVIEHDGQKYWVALPFEQGTNELDVRVFTGDVTNPKLGNYSKVRGVTGDSQVRLLGRNVR